MTTILTLLWTLISTPAVTQPREIFPMQAATCNAAGVRCGANGLLCCRACSKLREVCI